ncbi:hypothetical protein NKG94_06425 [Micromonospora sp. M12]
MVDAVAPYHAALTEAMRRAYGRCWSGSARVTRYRAGTSRFSVVDPRATPSSSSNVMCRRRWSTAGRRSSKGWPGARQRADPA